MTFRPGIRVAGLALLLTVAAPCTGRPVAELAPQPAVQVHIEQVIATIAAANRGEPAEDIAAMAEQLQQRIDDRQSLLQQILLYLADPRGNEETMSAALLLNYYNFTNDERIAAIVPHLDTDHVGLRDIMGEVLSMVDRPDGGRPDFAPYEAALAEGQRAPAGLIRYMYSVSPIDALSATARAYADGDSAAETVQQARELAQVRVRRESEETVDLERARREVDALSNDADWWVRLYAAHMVHARPDLGSHETVGRLRSDANELVREAVAD